MRLFLMFCCLFLGYCSTFAQPKPKPTKVGIVTPKPDIAKETDPIPVHDDKPFICIIPPMPQFPGGDDSLKRYIAAHINYPTPADSSEGRVIVRFIVKPNGAVDSVRIVRSLSPYCDSEVLRVFRQMPNWIPSKGQQENTWWTQPVTFRLQ